MRRYQKAKYLFGFLFCLALAFFAGAAAFHLGFHDCVPQIDWSFVHVHDALNFLK